MALAVDNSAWRRERAWLAYAGLIPFVVCTGLLLVAADAEVFALATDTLRSYAAVIASFLGAVHWGVAATSDDRRAHARLRWGVTPALIAWTLSAIPAPVALIGFALLFGLILVVDNYLLPALDDGYRRLRLSLTIVVVTTLAVAAAAASGGWA